MLVGGPGGWSVFTTIAGAVVAPGQVEIEQNRQVVEHPDGGVVEAILVRNGDLVAAGAPLLRLDGDLLRSELTVVEGQFFEILAREARLEAERDGRDSMTFAAELTSAAATSASVRGQIDGQIRLFQARAATMATETAQLRRRQDQIASQIGGITAQRASISAQRGFLADELQGQQSLPDNGLAEASRVLALGREEARAQGLAGDLDARKAEAEGRATEIEIEIAKLGSQRREDANAELRDLGSRELELAERRRSLAERIDRLVIRAPVAGIVHALQVTTPRSVVRPADPILYLVPQDRPFVIAPRSPRSMSTKCGPVGRCACGSRPSTAARRPD